MMIIIIIILIVIIIVTIKRKELLVKGKKRVKICHTYGRSISHIQRHVGQRTHTSESTDEKYKTFNIERLITCTINCNYRIAARLYPSKMFCFR